MKIPKILQDIYDSDYFEKLGFWVLSLIVLFCAVQLWDMKQYAKQKFENKTWICRTFCNVSCGCDALYPNEIEIIRQNFIKEFQNITGIQPGNINSGSIKDGVDR